MSLCGNALVSTFICRNQCGVCAHFERDMYFSPFPHLTDTDKFFELAFSVLFGLKLGLFLSSQRTLRRLKL